MSELLFSQAEMLEKFEPLLRTEGVLYRKFKKVMARRARGGEHIETITADGKETQNTAEAGDFIVKNLTEAGERYIVPKEKFEEKYEFHETGQRGYDVYQPKGQVVALELTSDLLKKLGLPDEFHFTAAWQQQMIFKRGDFLVSPPNFSEIYRIAEKEFHETYVC